MREIKFRAWDKEKNKMIYSDETYPRSEYKFEFEIFNDYKFTLSKMTDRFNVVDEEGYDYYIENESVKNKLKKEKFSIECIIREIQNQLVRI